MVDFNNLGKKAQDFLKTDQGEKTSDAGLDFADKLANKVTGGKHDKKIDELRDSADKKLGK